tara:strand:- start:1619 stop:1786 length:168 start_codon:yes stop_codon:yes gene_type:complete
MTYKTTHSGIVDYINRNSCIIELDTGELIEIESKLCSRVKEGDTISFYARKNESR